MVGTWLSVVKADEKVVHTGQSLWSKSDTENVNELEDSSEDESMDSNGIVMLEE